MRVAVGGGGVARGTGGKSFAPGCGNGVSQASVVADAAGKAAPAFLAGLTGVRSSFERVRGAASGDNNILARECSNARFAHHQHRTGREGEEQDG